MAPLRERTPPAPVTVAPLRPKLTVGTWLLASIGIAGCAPSPAGATLAQLQARAVYDLGCSARQIAVYHLDDRTKAVVGCGRRLLYVESCQQIRGRGSCTWVLNTPTFAQAQWPQWYTPPPATTFVVSPQPPAVAPRPMATSLFDGYASGPSQPAPSAPPASSGWSTGSPPAASSKPDPLPQDAPPRPTSDKEDEGRLISTDLFDPWGQGTGKQ